ncbi:MAG: hypothetical protein JW874_12590 [Spirochaetales bacterium]|nr:hypothetical protein [Spirochaetales bacterium]
MELKRLTLLTFGLTIVSIITIALFSAWTANEVFLFIKTSRSGLTLIADMRQVQGQTNELLVTDNVAISYLRWLETYYTFKSGLDDFQNSPRLNVLIKDKKINTRYRAFLILSERALYSLDLLKGEFESVSPLAHNEGVGLLLNSLYGKDSAFSKVAEDFRKTANYFSYTYENTISPLVSSLEKKSSRIQLRIMIIAGFVSILILLLTVILLVVIRKEESRIKNERLDIEMRMNKFELLKYFAGGIAHDFNNYLGAIFGNISIAKTYVKAGSELSQILDDVESASEQAIGLTKQFTTFARGDTSDIKVLNVEETIRKTTSFILRGSSIKCEFTFPADLHSIEIDESRFCEVINNILINSMQALPQGGIIEVAASNTYLKRARSSYFSPGDYVHISISDNGPGIPENIKDRIFNPFFTTKNKGSGLGLAICYSIIQENHGYITFESGEDMGTTFHIYLKASDKEPEARAHGIEEFKRGSGRVLLMDDDEKILVAVSRMLKQLGYSPEIVVEGKAAIKKYRQAMDNGLPFKAVILDYTIAGGSGARETLSELLKIDKNVRAIVSSGYTIDTIMPDYRDFGFRAFLKKGYTIQELGKALSEICS